MRHQRRATVHSHVARSDSVVAIFASSGVEANDEGRPPTYHELLHRARSREFFTDAERAQWREAYANLQARNMEQRGDDVNETSLVTPNLATCPAAAQLPGSDGVDGIHLVGESHPTRTRAPLILLVGKNRWRLVLHAVMLQVLGAEVKITSDLARAASIAAPLRRPVDLPKQFDAIIYDAGNDGLKPQEKLLSTMAPAALSGNSARDNRRKRLSLAVGGLKNEGGTLSDRSSTLTTTPCDGAPQDRFGVGLSAATGEEPGAHINLIAMVREEEELKRDPARRAARVLAPRLRTNTDVGDFCVNVRNSDVEYTKRTNFIVRNTIIATVGDEMTGRELFASGVDLFFRRPLAMHVRTLRRLLFPHYMNNRLRSSLIMAKPGFTKMLSLFTLRADGTSIAPSELGVGDGESGGVSPAAELATPLKPTFGDHLPNAREIASPLAVQVAAGAKRPREVPVIDDIDQDEVVADIKRELAAVKRDLGRRDKRIAQLTEEMSSHAAAAELDAMAAKHDLHTTHAELDSANKQLSAARKQIAVLQERIQYEAQQAVIEKMKDNGKEASAHGATVEQLQRRIEHLTGELERERRMAVARSIRRGVGMTDAQVQAGSGVTSSQLYRVQSKEAGSVCDIMTLQEYTDAQKVARDADTTIRSLRAALGSDAMSIQADLAQKRAQVEELQRQVDAFKNQIGNYAGENVKANAEMGAMKQKMADTMQIEAAAREELAEVHSQMDRMRSEQRELSAALSALWNAAAILSIPTEAFTPTNRSADPSVDHRAYAVELTRRLAERTTASMSRADRRGSMVSIASSLGSNREDSNPALLGAPSSQRTQQQRDAARNLAPLRGAPRRGGAGGAAAGGRTPAGSSIASSPEYSSITSRSSAPFSERGSKK
jgi:predicted  nucleic acid-binding Zn-ribbon protein